MPEKPEPQKTEEDYSSNTFAVVILVLLIIFMLAFGFTGAVLVAMETGI